MSIGFITFSQKNLLHPPQKKFKIPPCATTGEYGIICTVFGKQASLTQLVECHLAKVVVEGSSPLARSIGAVKAVNGSIAQLVEQVTLNHWVQGSNPCAPTIQPLRTTVAR